MDIVVRDQRGWELLEERRDCGLWGLPGGQIQLAQSVRGAMLREVEEDTGLTAEITNLRGKAL